MTRPNASEVTTEVLVLVASSTSTSSCALPVDENTTVLNDTSTGAVGSLLPLQTAAAPIELPLHARKGQMIPYTTFVATAPIASAMPNAGTGLVALALLAPFTWIGMYPGAVTTTPNRKRAAHTMGGRPGSEHLTIADGAIKRGVHMINEATTPRVANTWYVKLENGYCLYFAAVEVPASEELLTCYSRNYMKRPYSVPKVCSDPRCASAKHRTHSEVLEEWRLRLVENRPAGISEDFLHAAGLLRQSSTPRT